MTHLYEKLSPDLILNAIDSVLEQQDQLTSGHLTALNSYENRVYQVGIEEHAPVVAKFYRPERWSDRCILQEHAFSLAAVEDELPVIAPLQIGGETLFEFEGFRFALFPRQGGQSEQIERLEDFEQMGRLLARLHQTANCMESDARPTVHPQAFARETRQFILDHHMVSDDLLPAYESVSLEAVERVEAIWSEHAPSMKLVHGDLHPGNLVWFQKEPYLLDLDDCALAPRMQDIWMMLYGERDQMQAQLAAVARGYETFLPFPVSELPLIESLRTMRMMNYAAWLAKRWDDPAFPAAFPWFDSPRFWSDQILTLREQLSAFNEPPLQLVL